MRLFEFEAKELLKKHNIAVPEGVVLSKFSSVGVPCVVKAQVLFGNRSVLGGIKVCKTQASVKSAVSSLLGSQINGEVVSSVLVEDFVEIRKEFFVSFLFDTVCRSPVLLFSESGGSGIEKKSDIKRIVINPLVGLSKSDVPSELAPLLLSLYGVFVKEDCKLLEINPVAETDEGFVCLDAHIELDDFALARHKERVFPVRYSSIGRPFTKREVAVRSANDADYHGTVKYVELDGDIAFLGAGGGGSLTCMDALIDAGGRPANYSEFSGDPTDEKMYVLAKSALSKPGIKGCWIVGAVANFSRVDVMMSGIVRALKELKPKFPIVVRRAGPFEKEGLALLRDSAKEFGWDVEVFGYDVSLTSTAELIVRRAYVNSSK